MRESFREQIPFVSGRELLLVRARFLAHIQYVHCTRPRTRVKHSMR
jgi:hypothetical protein